MPAISVKRIMVKPSRIAMLVQLDPDAPRMTDARMAADFDRCVPSLRSHACVNGKGPTFGHIMSQTSVPHVLEHLIIDTLVRQDEAQQPTTFVGTTEWADETAGLARIEFRYTDDLAALRAVNQAVGMANEILEKYTCHQQE